MIRLGVWGGDKAWGYLGCGVIRVGGIWGCDAIKVGGIFGRCVMGEVGVCVCVWEVIRVRRSGGVIRLAVSEGVVIRLGGYLEV